jgi:TPR repeat protein
MYDSHFAPRLVDFGFGRANDPRSLFSTYDGNPHAPLPYTAPELHDRPGDSPLPDDEVVKVDVSAFVTILSELIMECDMRNEAIPNLPESDELIVKICRACRNPSPQARPEFYHIVYALREAGSPPFPGADLAEYDDYVNVVYPETLHSYEAECLFTTPRPAPADVESLVGDKDPVSQWRVGRMYAHGEGVPVNREKAFQYYLMAAEQGHPASMHTVAIYLRHGLGCQKDLKKAADWMKKASETGRTTATRQYASMVRNGEGCEPDHSEAVALYRSAADKGDRVAQYRLAEMLLNGVGCPPNRQEALKYYWMAHDSGLAEATCEIALYMLRDEHVDKGLNMYKQAAAQNCPSANLNLGILYRTTKDRMYGVAPDDAQAAQYFRRAADSGIPLAMTNLAVMYRRGMGVPKDEEEAKRLLQVALEARFDRAQHIWGRVLESEGKFAEALKYYGMAAEQGLVPAMLCYAKLALQTQEVEEIEKGNRYLERCRRDHPETPNLEDILLQYQAHNT